MAIVCLLLDRMTLGNHSLNACDELLESWDIWLTCACSSTEAVAIP